VQNLLGGINLSKTPLHDVTTANNPKAEVKITIPNKHIVNISGEREEHINLIQKLTKSQIIARGGEIVIKGTPEQTGKAEKVFHHLLVLAEAGINITSASVSYALNLDHHRQNQDMGELTKTIYVTPRGKQIKAKTLGQRYYIDAIRKHDITFGIGPAGTGKTYLAVVQAVAALKAKEVIRIVLVRPAVEAGEKLGFLPGDMQEKVNPYLRPIYDALDDILGTEMAAKYIERNIIEVVPLAYMRGRTLEEAFIILDEAQNTTPPQMKMFLTRMGIGSKAVITGDITQIDLPSDQRSGLIDAERKLKDVEGLSFCYLTRLDVVRHPLVQKIIEAYDRKWV
jgi:phosphate starvation-inducible PhoH-like protein